MAYDRRDFTLVYGGLTPVPFTFPDRRADR